MRNSRFRQNRKKLIAEINVVPYIDVTLVLLIIFMVTAPIVQQAVMVELPKTPVVSSAQTATPATPPFVISVTGEGLYKTSNNPNVLVSDKELEELVSEVVARSIVNKDQMFYIQGDTAAPYGKIIHLFTVLKVNGVQNVSLMTQPEAKGS